VTYTVKIQYGKKYTIDLKRSSLQVGDNVYVSIDFTENKLVSLHKRGAAFTDDEAPEPEEVEELPCCEDEEFLGVQGFGELGVGSSEC